MDESLYEPRISVVTVTVVRIVGPNEWAVEPHLGRKVTPSFMIAWGKGTNHQVIGYTATPGYVAASLIILVFIPRHSSNNRQRHKLNVERLPPGISPTTSSHSSDASYI